MSERRILTVIPARSGSKGLPDKNIRPLDGVPLLARTIRIAKAAGLGRIVVSTDSEAYAELARAEGAEVPFLRPAGLAGDRVRLQDVLADTLARLDPDHQLFDAVLSVQVTVPLLLPETLARVVEVFHKTGCPSVATASEIRHGHPYIAKKLVAGSDELVEDFISLPAGTPRYPRQVRPEAVYFNGAAFLRDRSLLEPPDPDTNALGRVTRIVMMSPTESINIDELFDFQLAQFLLEQRKND